MSVHLTASKTDQYCQGDLVMVARTRSTTCPVAMMEWYVAAATPPLSVFSEVSLKLSMVNTSKHQERWVMRAASGKATAAGLRQKSVQPPYSLRSGGATAAANAGVPDRLIKHHGRWKSESAKMGMLRIQLQHCCQCQAVLNYDDLLFVSLFCIQFCN